MVLPLYIMPPSKNVSRFFRKTNFGFAYLGCTRAHSDVSMILLALLGTLSKAIRVVSLLGKVIKVGLFILLI